MDQYKELARQLAQVFEKECLPLCQLDAQAGDGDHGVTISRGFAGAWAQVEKLPDDAGADEVTRTIGYGMLEEMGGASGPIFSTLFIQMAIVLKDRPLDSAATLQEVLDQSLAAISDLTGTQPGEKTMLDAIAGAAEGVRQSGAVTLEEALAAAEAGAQRGAEATVDMVATKGRAKFMGERSRGFMDAGSRSCALIFEIMHRVLGKEAGYA